MTPIREKFSLKRLANNRPKLKKFLVAVIGGTVVLIGVCLIVLPGPAVVVIPAGLAILATEFVWARNLLKKAKALGRKALGTVKSG